MERKPSTLGFSAYTSFLTGVLAAVCLVLAEPGVHADDCSPMRMDEEGGSMEHVAVRDQGPLGICWSEAESEMGDAIRFKVLHQTNYDFQTSAAATACGVAVEKGGNPFVKGAQSCSALDYMETHGICSEKSVEEGTMAETQTALSDFSETGRMTASLFGDEPSLESPISPRCAPLASTLPEDGVAKDPKLLAQLEQTSLDAPAMFKKLTRSCRTLASPPFRSYQLHCQPFPSTTAPVSPAGYKAKINQLLDAKPALPIEVDYCSSILDGGTGRSVSYKKSAADTCGGHASLIIGRRRVGGKCQFLIRNSWGRECAQYTFTKDFPQANCEEGKGNIWIDADVLTSDNVMLGLVPPPAVTRKR